MTAEERIEAARNGKAVQLYLPKDFSTDSSFPFAPGDEVIAQMADDGHSVVLTPVARLADAYPVRTSAPSREILSPSERRLVYGDLASAHADDHDTEMETSQL